MQITPAQEMARAGAGDRGGRDLSLNINVRVSPDMAAQDGFRKTGHQMAQDLSRQLLPVMRGL